MLLIRLLRYLRAFLDRLRDLGVLPGESLPNDHYAAFISYRRTDPDRRWANWLHDRLETYRLPSKLAHTRGLPRRLGRICQDDKEFPGSADLGAEVRDALDRSDWLIVVCSPRARASRWVAAEVEHFGLTGRAQS